MKLPAAETHLGSVRCAGVLKADGYGLGASQVAAALLSEGCDTFFVALLGEGIALRRSLGPGSDIFVLNGIPPGAEPDAAAANLAAVVNSPEQLAAWRAAAGRRPKLPAAIQVDSGMSRLGMAPRMSSALPPSGCLDGIDVRFVMSTGLRRRAGASGQ